MNRATFPLTPSPSPCKQGEGNVVRAFGAKLVSEAA
jgi:hypothetical protein